LTGICLTADFTSAKGISGMNRHVVWTLSWSTACGLELWDAGQSTNTLGASSYIKVQVCYCVLLERFLVTFFVVIADSTTYMTLVITKQNVK